MSAWHSSSNKEMDDTSNEKVSILLKLGDRTLQREVPYKLKSIFEEAERLFNSNYERAMRNPVMKKDKELTLTLVALQFAVSYLEERNSKDDRVLAPAMENMLSDIEKAIESLERD